MATIYRARALWQSWPGAPGYSNFYASGVGDPTVGASWVASIADLFNAIKAYLPSGLTIVMDGVIDEINDVNGQITDQISVTVPAPVVGAGSGNYSGATGGLISWTTGSFVAGRRSRGRTYLVPLISTAFASDGSMGTGFLSAAKSAADAYLAANDGATVIFRRPTPTHPVGGSAAITSAFVPDLAVVMRSRRT